MKISLNCLRVTLFICSTLWVTVAYPAPVTWDLTFTNHSGNIVATGQLSYDPDTTRCIYTVSCNAFYDPTSFETNEIINSISINGINGDGYFPSDHGLYMISAYWNGGDATTIEFSRHGGFYLFSGLWFIDSPFHYSTFAMDNFSVVSNTLVTGDWLEHDGDQLYYNFSGSNGSFSASLAPVPIPSAIVLFFSALMSFAIFTKKRRK